MSHENIGKKIKHFFFCTQIWLEKKEKENRGKIAPKIASFWFTICNDVNHEKTRERKERAIIFPLDKNND